ncbi:MAG: hypothetical protein NVS1B3_03040 [Candidatus Dormibacteraceae bacterium]
MRSVALTLLVLLASACGAGAAEIPLSPTPAPDAGSIVCRQAGTPPTALILAKEAVPDELDGVNSFVQDWGNRQGCFKATVVTTLTGANLAKYQVLIVDISHDQVLASEDAAGVQAFIKSGKRAAIFAWPIKLSDETVITASLAGAETSLSSASWKQAHGCGDWRFSDYLKTPFSLEATSYRYENFADSIFIVSATGPQRVIATSLFCPSFPGPTVLEVPGGVLAGFSFSYSVAFADNTIRAVGMKRLIVDVMHLLTKPAQLSGTPA